MRKGYNMSNSNNVIKFDNFIHTPLPQTQGDLDNSAVFKFLSVIAEKDKQLAEKDKQIQVLQQEKIQALQQEKKRTPHPFIAELMQWQKRKKDTKENRVTSYDKCMRIINVHIAPFFNDIDKELDTADVTYKMLQEFIAKVRAKGKDATIREAISTIIKPFLSEMYSQQVIPFNVAMGIKLRNLKKPVKRAITIEEVEKISRVAREMTPYQWIAVPLLAYTGMRKGELLALTWEDIDLVNGFIYIRKSNVTSSEQSICIQDVTKTESGIRRLPISAPLLDALKLHRDTLQKKGSHWIIRQERKDKPMNTNNFSRTMRKWREKAGVKPDVACHAFRHLYATTLAELDTAEVKAMILLGQKDPRMYTKVYADKKLLAKSSAMQDVQNLVAKRLIS